MIYFYYVRRFQITKFDTKHIEKYPKKLMPIIVFCCSVSSSKPEKFDVPNQNGMVCFSVLQNTIFCSLDIKQTQSLTGSTMQLL